MKNIITNIVLFSIGSSIGIFTLHWDSAYSPLVLADISKWWQAALMISIASGIIPTIHRYKIPGFQEEEDNYLTRRAPKRRLLTLIPFFAAYFALTGGLENRDTIIQQIELHPYGIGFFFIAMVVVTLIYPLIIGKSTDMEE